MKRSIKYVVVLCMLVVMMMPATSFAAGNQCLGGIEQAGLKVNAEQLQNLCNQFKTNNPGQLNMQTLKGYCEKLFAVEQNTKATNKNTNTNTNTYTKTNTTQTKTPVVTANSNTATGGYEAQVVDLVNKERAAQGLSALSFNAELSKVAEAKAADMRDKGYFSHTSPTYGSPFDMMKSFGVTYTAAGENIAKGYKTPASVMDGWMNSSGHKANILNTSYTEIGVGYVTDSNGTGYWVQMFIRP